MQRALVLAKPSNTTLDLSRTTEKIRPDCKPYRLRTPNLPFHYPLKSQFQTLHSENPVRFEKRE